MNEHSKVTIGGGKCGQCSKKYSVSGIHRNWELPPQTLFKKFTEPVIELTIQNHRPDFRVLDVLANVKRGLAGHPEHEIVGAACTGLRREVNGRMRVNG